MLSQNDVESYRREGYLSGRRLLTTAEAERFRQECQRTCTTPLELGDQNPYSQKRHASNRVKPYLLFPWAAELVRHPRVLDVIESVIGPDILVFHTTTWLKAPRSENYVPWHQDSTYFGLAPFEHVTAWVALTPSTRDSGCVRVMPGSHQNGQLGHTDDHADPLTMLSRGQSLDCSVTEDAAVDLVLEPGEVSLHHTLMAHSSGPNRSDGWRIGFGISYIPTSVRHIGPTRLSATLVRGTDRFNHFDHEAAPQAELDAAALAAHADSQSRYWQAASGIPEMRQIH
jgi:ectoine hydroxylase-related dioxygenase (phytanoyl-CoA dioxygenase family)